jgi:hypothetical protein
MHGEVTRVRATIAAVALLMIFCGLILAMPEVWRVLSSVIRHHKQQITSLFKKPSLEKLYLLRPRFGLRSLLIVLAIAPPIVAWILYPWFTFIWIEVLPTILATYLFLSSFQFGL